MMQFPKATIEAAIADINRVAEVEEGDRLQVIEVTYNEGDTFIIGESSQIINEFETRLAARSAQWDEESVDGVVLLDTLTNIQDNRTELRSRYNGEWQARYSITGTE